MRSEKHELYEILERLHKGNESNDFRNGSPDDNLQMRCAAREQSCVGVETSMQEAAMLTAQK